MSMLIAAVIFVPLLAVSIAHFVWSLGGTWPLRNRELLMKTVYGRPGMTRMPSRPVTFVVSILILAAGVIALALADHSGGGILLTVVGALLAVIFIARGVIGYTAGWRAVFSDEPFATLDRRNYSPLCLVLGAGYLILVLMRLI
jgi:hypothetical protein